MNVRKFIAATARDALHKVKELLGPDAIILSNRAIPGGVEIMAVAAGEMDKIVPTPVKEMPVPPRDSTFQLSSAPGQASFKKREAPPPQAPQYFPPLAPRPAPLKSDRSSSQTQRVDKPQAEIVPAEVMDEIRSLRKMFEQHLAGVAWGETARTEPVKTEILRQMLDAGFSPKLARDLLTALPN